MRAEHKDVTGIVEADEIEALFVQTANGMRYSDGKVTLEGLAAATLFFFDRPDRVTGHIPSREFVESWDKGPDSSASNPPNVVLPIFHPNDVSDIVVELKEPVLVGSELTYTVEILDGEMPANGGPIALFIDVIGRPLSPVSVAGMYRRDDRRVRREKRFRVGRVNSRGTSYGKKRIHEVGHRRFRQRIGGTDGSGKPESLG